MPPPFELPPASAYRFATRDTLFIDRHTPFVVPYVYNYVDANRVDCRVQQAWAPVSAWVTYRSTAYSRGAVPA